MSNLVPTWEDETNLAGEIELTDAQLGAVYGACDDHCDDWRHREHHVDRDFHRRHHKFIKTIHISLDISIGGDADECGRDW